MAFFALSEGTYCPPNECSARTISTDLTVEGRVTFNHKVSFGSNQFLYGAVGSLVMSSPVISVRKGLSAMAMVIPTGDLSTTNSAMFSASTVSGNYGVEGQSVSATPSLAVGYEILRFNKAVSASMTAVKMSPFMSSTGLSNRPPCDGTISGLVITYSGGASSPDASVELQLHTSIGLLPMGTFSMSASDCAASKTNLSNINSQGSLFTCSKSFSGLTTTVDQDGFMVNLLLSTGTGTTSGNVEASVTFKCTTLYV